MVLIVHMFDNTLYHSWRTNIVNCLEIIAAGISLCINISHCRVYLNDMRQALLNQYISVARACCSVTEKELLARHSVGAHIEREQIYAGLGRAGLPIFETMICSYGFGMMI